MSNAKLEQYAFPVCCCNKQRNFTTNQASCYWNTRRWRSSVWKFKQVKLCLFDLNLVTRFFCWKTRFEASQVVFWSLSCYKELKLTTNWFTGRTLRGLLIQMQNISLRSSGMRRKQNFDIVFGFKSDTAVLTFTFRFLSSLLFSLFLPHFFFLLLGI